MASETKEALRHTFVATSNMDEEYTSGVEITGIETGTGGTGDSGQIFFRGNHDTDSMGFNMTYNGSTSTIGSTPAASLGIGRHQNHVVGSAVLTIPRATGFVGVNNMNPTEQMHIMGNMALSGNLHLDGSTPYIRMIFANGTPTPTIHTVVQVVDNGSGSAVVVPMSTSKGPHPMGIVVATLSGNRSAIAILGRVDVVVENGASVILGELVQTSKSVSGMVTDNGNVTIGIALATMTGNGVATVPIWLRPAYD